VSPDIPAGNILLGHLADGRAVHVSPLEEGAAFKSVHQKLTTDYQQIDPPRWHKRPTGSPQKIEAGARCVFFQCEAMALQALGVGGRLERAISLRTGNGPLMLGDLIDEAVEAMIPDIAAAEPLISAVSNTLANMGGLYTQADLDAREERMRDVARLGGRDNLRVVR
jgi:hypothetical protein